MDGDTEYRGVMILSEGGIPTPIYYPASTKGSFGDALVRGYVTDVLEGGYVDKRGEKIIESRWFREPTDRDGIERLGRGMVSGQVERIEPLRIAGREVKYLARIKDIGLDKVTARHLNCDPTVVEFKIEPHPGSRKLSGFLGHILLSRVDGQYLLTATSYVFEGPVGVHSWKADDPELEGDPEREDIAPFNQTEMDHVIGFDEAVISHREVLDGLMLDHLLLDEALSFYKAMRDYVPEVRM
jgi:hypothetical protein